MQVFFLCGKFGSRSLAAFNFTDHLQRDFFYTNTFMSYIFDFLFLYDVTCVNNNVDFRLNWRLCQLASQFSTNRVDEDLY